MLQKRQPLTAAGVAIIRRGPAFAAAATLAMGDAGA
jgi:hypothetical protein